MFKPISVTKFNAYIKQIFESEELLHGICVFGEISGWSNVRGAAYFTLKDEESALSCVCFNADSFPDVKNGDSVMVSGSAKYYTKGGKLNFNVFKIEPYGESVLFQKYLQLKEALGNKGYFDESKKKGIPENIKRIGVVSSEGGAVIQDIINIRTRRNPNIDIVLFPTKVQGNGAENEIAHGIEILDNYDGIDAIVVARGGGSFEDLAPFNTEVVADAVYHCKKFIMSAVGHETDFTIIDFCSDMRAPTPSAAAELLCVNLEDKKQKFFQDVTYFYRQFDEYIDNAHQKLQNEVLSLVKNIEDMIEDNTNFVNQNIINLKYLSEKILDSYFQRLVSNKKILEKLDPAEVLKLGYACIKGENGFITSLKELSVGMDVEMKFKDGIACCEVNKLKGDV